MDRRKFLTALSGLAFLPLLEKIIPAETKNKFILHPDVTVQPLEFNEPILIDLIRNPLPNPNVFDVDDLQVYLKEIKKGA